MPKREEGIKFRRLLNVRRKWWLEGNLKYMLRGFMKEAPPGKIWSQIVMYDWVKEWKKENPDRRGPLIIWCRRRAGKSTVSVIEHLEDMLKEPDRHGLYIVDYQKHCDDIVRPILLWALREAPLDIKIKWRANKLLIQNPRWKSTKSWSTLTLLGSDKADTIRGLPSAARVTIDEARDITNLDYLMESLIPHVMIGQKDPLLKFDSTPPSNLECPLIKRYNEKAKLENRVLTIDGLDDCSITQMDIEDVMQTADIDENSAAFLREIRAQLVPDISVAVVPEYFKFKEKVIVKRPEDLPRPRFFMPQVQIDSAFSVDKTAILFGYIDHENGLIVVEDCAIGERWNTMEIARVIVTKEKEVWPNLPPGVQIRYRGDMLPGQVDDLFRNPILRQELNRPNGIYVVPVPKNYDRLSALETLRSYIGRVRIHVKAQPLIYQLEVGTVRYNRDRTKVDFVRTTELGHLDAVAALRDMVKDSRIRFPVQIPERFDPYAPNLCIPPGWKPPPPPAIGVFRNQGMVTRDMRGVYRDGGVLRR